MLNEIKYQYSTVLNENRIKTIIDILGPKKWPKFKSGRKTRNFFTLHSSDYISSPKPSSAFQDRFAISARHLFKALYAESFLTEHTT